MLTDPAQLATLFFAVVGALCFFYFVKHVIGVLVDRYSPHYYVYRVVYMYNGLYGSTQYSVMEIFTSKAMDCDPNWYDSALELVRSKTNAGALITGVLPLGTRSGRITDIVSEQDQLTAQ